MDPENTTLKDLYVAQVVTLAHILRIEAEAKGATAEFEHYLRRALSELRATSSSRLELLRRWP